MDRFSGLEDAALGVVVAVTLAVLWPEALPWVGAGALAVFGVALAALACVGGAGFLGWTVRWTLATVLMTPLLAYSSIEDGSTAYRVGAVVWAVMHCSILAEAWLHMLAYRRERRP